MEKVVKTIIPEVVFMCDKFWKKTPGYEMFSLTKMAKLDY